jgi:hypothetical protein
MLKLLYPCVIFHGYSSAAVSMPDEFYTLEKSGMDIAAEVYR